MAPGQLPASQRPPQSDAEVALSAAHTSVAAEVLLQWAFDKVDGTQAEVFPTEFYPSLGLSKIINYRDWLMGRGLARFSPYYQAMVQENNRLAIETHYQLERQRMLTNPTTYVAFPPPPLTPFGMFWDPIQLTRDGIATAERFARNWEDRAFRHRMARTRLLAWLYDQNCDQGPVPVRGFYAHPESIVSGYFLSPRDVESAMTYLAQRDFIEAAGPGSLKITHRGRERVEEGGDMTERDSSYHNEGKYVINSISGGSVVIGEPGTVNMYNGIDAHGLGTLMDAIARLLPNLGLSGQDQRLAEDMAGQVLSETRADAPDRGRIHAALGKLRDLLAKAGNEVLIRAIDVELARLGLP